MEYLEEFRMGATDQRPASGRYVLSWTPETVAAEQQLRGKVLMAFENCTTAPANWSAVTQRGSAHASVFVSGTERSR
ncbi:hypothetical protein E2562_021588 [Oryza meyeriana var. granulata]|uniref:Uncharacterized protein n=1 Tax=Oryza meyeriana var. granulata TaxID=110450 RepID=A0A6G1EY45_9ORYZ|nr:hypothetical protein E2562_021588 [Oryza meyeriana var. granulata]